MEKRGPFTYRLTEADMVEAGRSLTGRRLFRPPLRWLMLAIIVLAIVLLALDLLDGRLNLASLAVILAAPLAMILTVRVVVPRAMKRQFHQSAAMRDEHTFMFDEESLNFSTSRGSGRVPMHELYAFSETDTLILLHQTEGYFNPVPKTALGDNGVSLVAALARNGVKQF